MPSKQTNYLDQLKEIADVLFTQEDDFVELKQATDAYYNMLLEITALNTEAEVNREHIYVPRGKAIGPTWAAMCVQDLVRTKRFTSGVYQAVQDCLAKPDRSGPVHILYAGTGPFATLVLPLLTRFSPEEIQFHLLEINEISIICLKKLIKTFDALDYIAEFYHCDAANFIVPDALKNAEILVVECLQHALLKEPQVGICYNLLPQMKEDIVLIPERIDLSTAFFSLNHLQPNDEQTLEKPAYHNVDTIFSLHKDCVSEVQPTVMEDGIERFPEVASIFPEDLRKDFNMMGINTEIQVYKDKKILFNQSGLTMPYYQINMDTHPDIIGLRTYYEMSATPALITKDILA